MKDAVADGRLDPRRYDSYIQMLDSPYTEDTNDDDPEMIDCNIDP